MKNKNKETLIIILFIVVGLIIFSTIGFVVYKDFFTSQKNDVVKKLDLYGYSLEERDNEIYKNGFDSLTETLNAKEINYEEYAKEITKLFVIDFYTLKNKLSNSDVGGMEFIYPDLIANFKLKAKNTMYKYIEINYDGKRTQKLPEVSNVTINDVQVDKYIHNDKEYESYKVKCSWEYVEDMGYQQSITLTLIKDGTKLYIIEGN